MVSRDHPRYKSIIAREKLVEGYEKGITALAGLIAHGRGEAFDYLLGERTTEPARRAIRAAAALLLSAKNPVISVNGNTAVLCPGELVELAGAVGAKLEVNLFYRSPERERAIEKVLMEHGAERVYGVEPTGEIPGIASPRAQVDRDGILAADVVLVALEDGDRTEALKKAGNRHRPEPPLQDGTDGGHNHRGRGHQGGAVDYKGGRRGRDGHTGGPRLR